MGDYTVELQRRPHRAEDTRQISSNAVHPAAARVILFTRRQRYYLKHEPT
jgi:hypothetical protein